MDMFTLKFNDETAATESLESACERLREISIDQPEEVEGSTDAAGITAERKHDFKELQIQAAEAGGHVEKKRGVLFFAAVFRAYAVFGTKNLMRAGFVLTEHSHFGLPGTKNADRIAVQGTFLDRRPALEKTLSKSQKVTIAAADYVPADSFDWRIERPDCVNTQTVRDEGLIIILDTVPEPPYLGIRCLCIAASVGQRFSGSGS
jgi:hypothetical protein